MTALTIASAGRSYAVEPDVCLQVGALVVGRAVDELTGAPPRDRLSVSARLGGVPAAVAGQAGGFAIVAGDGGAFALSGAADRAFPDLAVTPYTLEVTLGCPGFLPTPVTVGLPAGTTAFPVALPEAVLRRPAVLLAGRVVTAAVAPVPIAGAQVEVVAPAGMVGFGAPFAFPHEAGTDVIPVSLVPTGPDLDLLADVVGGAMDLGLARRDGLTAGTVLELGAGADREYAVVTAVQGPVDLTLPGTVAVRTPLAFSHRQADGPARLVVEGAPGPSAALTAAAFAEDRVAFVDDPSALPDDGPVRVADADAARVEYHVARRARATTDAAGYYRLGPIGRTSTVTVHVTPPVGPPPGDAVHIVSHGTPENVLNLRA